MGQHTPLDESPQDRWVKLSGTAYDEWQKWRYGPAWAQELRKTIEENAEKVAEGLHDIAEAIREKG